MLLKTALKEWSVAVDALVRGESILLLRKGGIREQQGKFSVQGDNPQKQPCQPVLLFPTFEHQKPDLLKREYQTRVAPVPPGWHPETLTLHAWADITHVFLTQNEEKVAALSAFHIWQPQLAQSRLKWKAQQPLHVLLLRVYRFTEPVTIPWQAAYGGCRSWVELAQGHEVDTDEPAIAESDYSARVAAISQCLSSQCLSEDAS